MAEKEPTKGSKKAEKLNSDIYREDLELLNQTITEKSLLSRKEGLHAWANAYRGMAQNEEKQANTEINCEFFLSANKKFYCVYESYGRHRQLISAEECSKCKIHLWKLPSKTKIIPRCPKTTGLYNPQNCPTCFEEAPATYGACETRRQLEYEHRNDPKSEPKGEPAKAEKEPKIPMPSAKDDELERLKEKERIKTEANKQRLQDELDAKKEEAKLKRSQRSFNAQPKVDWGNSEGMDTFGLGE
jgi:hypothetical protein